jgi:hypothetical protein
MFGIGVWELIILAVLFTMLCLPAAAALIVLAVVLAARKKDNTP